MSTYWYVPVRTSTNQVHTKNTVLVQPVRIPDDRIMMSDIRYRIIAILLYDIVCFDIRYRMLWYRTSKHTISYYDIVYKGHTISYNVIYDVATYDIVCLTYDVVCNIRCRMFHIRCRILQSYATSYVVGNTSYVLVFLSYTMSHTTSYEIFLWYKLGLPIMLPARVWTPVCIAVYLLHCVSHH